MTSYLGLYFLKAQAKAGIWRHALSQRKSHLENSQMEHEEKEWGGGGEYNCGLRQSLACPATGQVQALSD